MRALERVSKETRSVSVVIAVGRLLDGTSSTAHLSISSPTSAVGQYMLAVTTDLWARIIRESKVSER